MNTAANSALALLGIFSLGAASAQSRGDAAQETVSFRYDPGESRWIAEEAKRAAAVLSGSPADVLIVPFQVDGDSFDAVERSLMARTLAEGMRVRAHLVVADPTFVEQSLGSAARSIAEPAILALAAKIGAKSVVLGFVGHDNAGTYHTRIEALRVDGSADRRTVFDVAGVAFGDTNPPYVTFRSHRDEIVDAIAGTRGTNPSAASARSGARTLPHSLDDLDRTSRADPVAAASILQLLGVLHPQDFRDRARDGLFERSIVILDGMAETPEIRALRARAWTYLNRRPFALAQLKAGSDEEVAMRAYLDGDLERLSAATAKIREPLPSLVATLERERTRLDYGQAADPRLTEALLERDPCWGPLAVQALALVDPWGDHSNTIVKLALDSYWPIPKYGLNAAFRAGVALQRVPTEHEVSRLAIEHLNDVAASAVPSPDGRPVVADVAQLLREYVAANVVMGLRQDTENRGLPAVALTEAAEYEPLLAGQPEFVMARGWAEFRVSVQRQEPEKTNLKATAYEHLRQGVIWARGQVPASEIVMTSRVQFFPGSGALDPSEGARTFFDSDWPNLPGWYSRVAQFAPGGRRAMLEHCVAYTLRRLNCLVALHDELLAMDRTAADGLLAANSKRFVGNPRRIEFLAATQRSSGNDAAASKVFTDAIEAGTNDWEPYLRVGTELASRGKPQDAAAVFLKYPAFRSQGSADGVTLSNRAYEAGSWLYWAGAYEQARPLYEFAAALRTGSEASITSASRLALLDRDLETAARLTAERAQRYASQYALRDSVMLLAALGERATAWAVFNSLESQIDKPEFWIGAYAVQRMEDAKLDAIAAWAFERARSTPRTQLDSLAMRHVFLSGVTDREITSELATTLRARDPGPEIIRDRKGMVRMGTELVFGSPFFGFLTTPQLPPGQSDERVDSRLTMMATALAALQHGDYERAFEVFDRASRVFPLQEFLPYYAWAAANVGMTARVDLYLRNVVEAKPKVVNSATRGTEPFDEFLALALLEGFRGETDAALDHLIRANAVVVHTEERAMFTRYEITEVAELLYEKTSQMRYRDFIVDMARRNSLIDPAFSWPHAFAAKYSPDEAERRLELARALYLDPSSRRAQSAAPKDREAARRILAAGNPLLARKPVL